ncbi:MAG: hypothetical protein GY757_02335 [bacterium]|nr:hypothetical protein [bacterium]
MEQIKEKKNWLFIFAFIILIFLSFNFTHERTSASPIVHVSTVNPPVKTKPRSPYRVIQIGKTIGVEEENDEDAIPLFSGIFDIDCDSEGNILVLDGRRNCVKKFSGDGKLLGEYFQRGKGPEDISNAMQVAYNDHSKKLYVVNEYGFELKEYNQKNKLIRSYRLPEQFYNYCDFIDEKRLVYSARKAYGEEFYFNFKILNLDNMKIVKEIAPTSRNSTLDVWQTFALNVGDENKKLLWAATSDKSKLEAYNLDSRKREIFIDIAEKLKDIKFKNNKAILFSQNGRRFVQPFFHNLVQPFWLNPVSPNNQRMNREKNMAGLFFLLKLQEFTAMTSKAALDPKKSSLGLCRVNGEQIQSLGILKDCDDFLLGTTYQNRIIIYANFPYPRVKILEISKNSGERKDGKNILITP